MWRMMLRRRLIPGLQIFVEHSFHSSLFYSDFTNMKAKVAPLQERKMVDRMKLWVKGGEGGAGCISFRRSRHDRRGRPDGGNGGKGGNVILECSASAWDLSNLQHHLNANRGGQGFSKNKVGSRGADKVAQVPVGTVIHLVRGECPLIMENTQIRDLQPWEIPDVGTDRSSGEVSIAPVKRFRDHMNGSRRTNSLDDKYTVHETKSAKSLLSQCRDTSSSMLNKGDPLCSNNDVAAETDDCSYSEHCDTDIEYMMSECEAFEEDTEEESMQYSVAELTKPGQRFIVAQGGEGGLGNVSFGRMGNSKNKRVKQHDESSDVEDLDDEATQTAGKPGSEAILILELKSIADIGLVGMPNAGKSTLLGAISRAKPTIGHYAFTTLRPNIGNLNYDDFFNVTIADIPGLIKGAHENRGLGHAFLRHIERTKVLAYVVDLSASLDGRKGIPPWEQLRDLVMELESHQAGLSDRQSLIVANKIDEEGTDQVYNELQRRVPGIPIYPICAVLEEGIPELKAGLRRLVDGIETCRISLAAIMVD